MAASFEDTVMVCACVVGVVPRQCFRIAVISSTVMLALDPKPYLLPSGNRTLLRLQLLGMQQTEFGATAPRFKKD